MRFENVDSGDPAPVGVDVDDVVFAVCGEFGEEFVDHAAFGVDDAETVAFHGVLEGGVRHQLGFAVVGGADGEDVGEAGGVADADGSSMPRALVRLPMKVSMRPSTLWIWVFTPFGVITRGYG